jgi:hypothetical protein
MTSVDIDADEILRGAGEHGAPVAAAVFSAAAAMISCTPARRARG